MRIPPLRRRGWRSRPRGQVIVIFALSSVVFVGMCAVVVDVASYWSNNLRIQRAADAAALAGAVLLPANVSGAVSRAVAEATRNGYTAGGGTTVTPCSDDNKPTGCTGGGGNDRQLNVTISAPVSTFFMRVFGINSITATRTGKAEFVLPVPMGSPENYYGVFGPLRRPETMVTTTKGTNAWTNPNNVFDSDGNRASSATNGQVQAWGFASDTAIYDPIPAGATIYGIEVWIEGRTATSSSNCRVEVSLSWNNGSTWTTGSGTGIKTVNLTSSEPDQPGTRVGGTSDTWGAHPWVKADFAANQFRIRVTNIRTGSCNSTAQIDSISVRANYNLPDPYGAGINPRGFWGTLINQGAEKVNGDAYLPKWNPRTSTQNAEYSPGSHYNYAYELPAGTSNGELWIFDPVFCATSGNGGYGTGDRYFSGSSATSAFYTLYDTNDTPYDLTDDTLVADSGSLFRATSGYSDTTLGGPSGLTDCSTGATTNTADGRYWHNRWWRIASGLAGDTTYRLWTRSTDPSNATAMDNANGHNSFAIWGKATGTGTPRVYGIGSMEMFTPLDAGQPATLYMAQIEAVHAGKTMEIKLWDPGDTGDLSATLEILKPTATGYQAAAFDYSAAQAASGAASCNSRTGTGVTSLTTNTGGSSLFNGCWVTILIPLPDNYTAPTPPGEPGPGWWKIKYTMGDGDSNAFDLTTWEVRILGNPVHLKVP